MKGLRHTNRRAFLKATAAAAVALGPLAPRRAHGQRAKEVVYAGFGGSFQEAVNKAWLQPFERETGIKVTVATFDPGRLSVMVETNSVEWDVCDIAGTSLGAGVTKNLFEPLDYSVIDTQGMPAAAHSKHAIAYTMFGTIIAWNTRRFTGSQRPANWADFWDVKRFPGPRALWKVPYVSLEAALMADGVPPGKLYPLDLDRAFRKLDEIKPHVKVWWTSGQQPVQLLADGEVDLANGFDGRLTLAKKEGAKLDYTFNEGILASTWYIVPRGARNRENAMRLIAYILQPRNNARLAEFISAAPAHPKAYAYVKPEIASQLVAAPQNASMMALQDEGGWWAKNFEVANKRFQEWIVK